MQKIDSKSSHNFDLQLLPKSKIVREVINGKRHYVTPDGVFPSVTTVLGRVQDKTALNEWRARVGEAEANKISTQAANRGTAVHDMLEKYVKREDYQVGQMPANKLMFDSIRSVLDKNLTKVYGIEYPLWSKRLYTAGTTDMIGEYNGVTSIVDFKTSRRLKEESWIESYFLQSTVYAMMTEARTDLIVPQIVIIIGVDDEPEPQIFVKSSYDFRDKVQTIFKK